MKDKIYIHTFGTLPDLRAAISYYRKTPNYRHTRNNKVELFKNAIQAIKNKGS